MKGHMEAPFFMGTVYKIPESVLVVIFTPALEVLLIRRADGGDLGGDYWQSVTGSKDTPDESTRQTAEREVFEETGIDCAPCANPDAVLQDWHLQNVYCIYPQWLHRYAPGVTLNTEHVFGLQVPAPCPVRLNPREHTAFQWLPHRQAADLCFSPSNAEAILQLSRFGFTAEQRGAVA
jgi:dATP pyrophosphohydrolase